MGRLTKPQNRRGLRERGDHPASSCRQAASTCLSTSCFEAFEQEAGQDGSVGLIQLLSLSKPFLNGGRSIAFCLDFTTTAHWVSPLTLKLICCRTQERCRSSRARQSGAVPD